MQSISYENLDSELINKINQLAISEGVEPHKILERLLRKALETIENKKPNRDVSEFFGNWSDEETKHFNESIKIFEQIDEDLWK